jgi:hypothetical protein
VRQTGHSAQVVHRLPGPRSAFRLCEAGRRVLAHGAQVGASVQVLGLPGAPGVPGRFDSRADRGGGHRPFNSHVGPTLSAPASRNGRRSRPDPCRSSRSVRRRRVGSDAGQDPAECSPNEDGTPSSKKQSGGSVRCSRNPAQLGHINRRRLYHRLHRRRGRPGSEGRRSGPCQSAMRRAIVRKPIILVALPFGSVVAKPVMGF